MSNTAVCVTIFSTGSKGWLVSNFTELHALTLAAHSYVLLLIGIAYHNQVMYSVHNATNILIMICTSPALWSSYTSYKVDPECIKLRQRFRVTDLLLVLTEAYSIFVHIGHGTPTPEWKWTGWESDATQCPHTYLPPFTPGVTVCV